MYVFPAQRQRPIRISALSRTSDSSTRAMLHSDHSMVELQVVQTSGTSSLMLLRRLRPAAPSGFSIPRRMIVG
jgi:hypothetical protein